MDDLSPLERDTIAEVGNISLGSSATALSVILDTLVDITTPRLSVIEFGDIQQNYPIPCLLVEVEYTAGLKGTNMLLIKEADAVIIAAMMMGEPHEGKEGPLNEIELSAIQEAMNQMMGSMATSMSELFQRPIEISPPAIERINLTEEKKELTHLKPDEKIVQVEFTMKIEEIIDSVMIQVIPLDFAKTMAGYLLAGESETAPVSEEELASGPEAVADPDPVEAEAPHLDNAVEEAINAPAPSSDQIDMSDLEKDTISEVGNISLGSSATALSTILDKMVDITTPKLSIVKVSEIQEKYPVPCVLVEVDYISGLEGSNMLLVKKDDAMIIASLMMGDMYEGIDGKLSEIELSAVQEAMNQMMGSMATSMSDLFQRPIDISPPRMRLIDLGDEELMLSGLSPDEEVVHVEFKIKVEDMIDSVMFQVIPIEFARKMAGHLLYGFSETASDTDRSETQQTAHISEDKAAAVSNAPAEVPEAVITPVPESAPERQRKPLSAKLPSSVDLQKLEMVKDIPMDVTVVLGTARMPLGKLFALGKGGIVDLDCSANDPVEILANDRLLAKGEVVMINDQLGVRITEIQFEDVIESYGI